MLRRFLCRFLEDDQAIGCEDDEHDEITRCLELEGWFVRGGILAVGQPVKPVRGRSTDTAVAVEPSVEPPSVPDRARDLVDLLDRQVDLLRTVATAPDGSRIVEQNLSHGSCRHPGTCWNFVASRQC